MATYKHIRSNVDSKRPTTSLADGQIAINTNVASPGLFFKDSAGTALVKVGPVHVGTSAPNAAPATGGSTGNSTGEQWLDTSLTPAQLKVWNGSAWVGVVADELPVSKLQNGSAYQLIQTDAAGTGVEWTDNIDVPGTLAVTSTATFDSTASFASTATFSSIASHPLGTAAAPTITFTGDTDTGVYSPGVNQVALSTAGTGRLFVAANGNIGVATATPATALDVNGDLTIADKIIHSGDTNTSIRFPAADTFTVETANVERLRVDSSGRLGVGTISPSRQLQVENSSGNAVAAIVSGTSSSSFLLLGDTDDDNIGQIVYSNTDNALFVETNGSERLRITSTGQLSHIGGGSSVSPAVGFNGSAPSNSLVIDSTGKLGVGTSAPTHELEVAGRIALVGLQTGFQNSSIPTFYRSGSTAGSYPFDNFGHLIIQPRADGNPRDIIFATGASGVNKTVIDSSGNVGIGTTSPDAILRVTTSAVNEAAQANDIAVFERNDNGYIKIYNANNKIGGLAFGDPEDAFIGAVRYNHSDDAMDFFVNNSERLRIDSSGKVGIGTTSPDTKLDVNGNVQFGDGGGFDMNVNGTRHQFSIGGSEKMRIESSGKVGIGTASPKTNLHVQQSAVTSAPSRNSALYLENNGNCEVQFVGNASNDCQLRFGTTSNSFKGALEYDLANNNLKAYTNGFERLRIDSSGRLLLGTSTARQTGSGFTAQSQVEGAGTVSASSFTVTSNRSVDDLGGRLNFARSKGGAIGSNTIVDADAEYGGIYFFGADGSDTDSIGAQISAYVDGTPGANDMPGRLVFSTTADGASSPTERLRIDSSGQIDFNSNARIEEDGLFKTSNGTAAAPSHAFLNDPDNGMFRATTNTLGFSTAATERLRIDSSGKVGIGTTSPASKLHLEDSNNTVITLGNTSYDNGVIQYYNGSIALKTGTSGGDRTFQVHTAGSERLRIDSSGRLLVGTSSVLSTDSGHIIQASDAVGAKLSLGRDDSSVSSGNAIGKIMFSGNAGGTYQPVAEIACDADGDHANNDKPGRLTFSTTADGASSPTERMRIKQDGRVMIASAGDFGAGSDGERLLVIGDADYACSFRRNTSTGGIVVFKYGSSSVGSISTNGTNTAYNTSSDYRLKENVVPLTGAVDRVNQLQVNRFNFIADPDKTVDGFIAHEAQSVVPECATGTKDEVDDEGNPVYQGIDQSKLVPLLTAALQEAIAKIETLEQRLTDAGIA